MPARDMPLAAALLAWMVPGRKCHILGSTLDYEAKQRSSFKINEGPLDFLMTDKSAAAFKLFRLFSITVFVPGGF